MMRLVRRIGFWNVFGCRLEELIVGDVDEELNCI